MKIGCSRPDRRAAVRLRDRIQSIAGMLAAYTKSRGAGSMTVSASIVLVLMAGSGAAMSNYAWRETHGRSYRR